MRPDLRSLGGLLASGAMAGASLSVSALLWQACAARPRRPSELARRAGRPAALLTFDLAPDLLAHGLEMPVLGISRQALTDSFLDPRGSRWHEAIDIMAPRDTPVLAASEGSVSRLLHSRSGGISVYQVDASGRYCYYYAHLDGYAPGLHEGQSLAQGEPIGRVGTTGNAPRHAPHLHFAIYRLDDPAACPSGTPVNPYPILAAGGRAESPVTGP